MEGLGQGRVIDQRGIRVPKMGLAGGCLYTWNQCGGLRSGRNQVGVGSRCQVGLSVATYICPGSGWRAGSGQDQVGVRSGYKPSGALLAAYIIPRVSFGGHRTGWDQVDVGSEGAKRTLPVENCIPMVTLEGSGLDLVGVG